MKLVEINWNPTDRQLRQFGMISFVALPLLGWLWSGRDMKVTAVTAAIGAVLAIVGWLYPRGLKPVYVGLTLVTIPIGMVVSELAMAVVFFGLIVPTGLVFRLIGRDSMQRKLDREAGSYWQPKKQPRDATAYLRQS
ncbi:MAG: hypothetical protein HQ567_02650 [Candidatus Nealsonbacteria bacterium]|nr:hypothetical protein [Candidatus Nealsonbacteria bacterium]